MRPELARSTEIRDRKVNQARVLTRATTVRLLTAVAAAALLGGALAPRGDAAATVTAELVKDINPTGDGLPGSLAVFNGSLYFGANDGTNGYELWKSDGTAAGTAMLKDINSTGDGNPGSLAVFNGSLYFHAWDGSNGQELWKSDGTEAGTTMVKDINPTGDGNPGSLAVFNGSLYFGADDGVLGYNLWKSDGTDGGTTMVKDLNPTGDSSAYFLTVFNGSLYFAADDGSNGIELWKSDGTGAGTAMLKDINPTGVSSTAYLTVFNGSLYFAATNGVDGQELWKSDGTLAGTIMAADINSTGGSYPNYLTVFNGSLYFAADGGTAAGNELWKSDGTAAGTAMLKDINPTGNGNPGSFAVFNGNLYFQAGDGVHGTELWKSDGTGVGTAMVVDLNPSGSGNPNGLTAIGSNLYFSANDGTNGYELWRAGDVSPPETQITSGPSGATADSTPTFAFSSDEPGTFQCSTDGGAMSACSSPATIGPLADGAHSFQVRAVDSSGNIDASPVARSVSVDTIAPDTSITSGPKALIRKKTASVSFSSSETSSGFECSLDGSAWSACTSPKAYSGLADRKHTFNVRAKDQAGNIDTTPSSRAFTVDTHAPQTTFAKHPKKIVRTVKSMVKVTFTFRSSEKSSRFACKLDKKKWKPCSSRTTYKVKRGKHTLLVRATDRAGNRDRTPAKWGWTVKRG